jgi:hypothetical protein
MDIEFFKKLINSKLKLFLLVSFIILWLSLGIHPINLLNYSWNSSNFINTLNFFIGIATLLIPIILTFILLIIKKNRLIFLKLGLLPLCIILYFICQIIGIILSNNELINLYFTLNGISTLFLLVLIYKTFSKKEFNFFLIFSLIILATSFLFYFYKYLKIFILIEGQTLYGAWGAVSFLENNEAIPRPTGLARTGLILFICLYFAYFINNSKKILYILIFLAASILLFQSRTIIFLFVLFIFSSYFFFKKKLFFFKLKKTIFIFFIIPILLFVTSNFLKIKLIESNLISKEFIYRALNLDKNNYVIDKRQFNKHFSSDQKYTREIDPETFTSGRVRDWEKILSAELKLFGYGPQGDRKLTNGSTAANALLYALSSAGIAGLFIMILIYFKTIKELYKIYLEKNYYNFYIYSSICILIILLFRSILESSFAVFGIDYIIFLQCYLIIKKRKKV